MLPAVSSLLAVQRVVPRWLKDRAARHRSRLRVLNLGRRVQICVVVVLRLLSAILVRVVLVIYVSNHYSYT